MKVVFSLTVLLAIIMMTLSASSMAETDEYLIVANKQLPGNTISKASLKGIYLRETKNWGSGGSEIVVVDLSSQPDFYLNLFQKTYTQMQAYWLNMRIKYSVTLPVNKKDAEGVKEFIAGNKDAIGFIKASDVDDRVKVLKLVSQ
jgi:ABC-type phosphate transport system substrate-binding protein